MFQEACLETGLAAADADISGLWGDWRDVVWARALAARGWRRGGPRAGAPLPATSALSAHWGNILAVLDGLLATLRANHCPAFLVRKLFQQLFSFVNVQVRPAPSRPLPRARCTAAKGLLRARAACRRVLQRLALCAGRGVAKRA